MRETSTRKLPNNLLIVSAFAGAFLAFLLPEEARTPGPHAHGMMSAFIAFELNYMNLITSVGAVVLVYWLIKRRMSGRETLVVCAALGFVSIKLILASLRFVNS